MTQDLTDLSSAEQRAFAAGLREALGIVDRSIGGERRAHGVLPAGREIHELARTADEAGSRFHRAGPLVRPATIRQSLIQAFDRCALSAQFELDTDQRQRGYLAARGSLFHLWVAEALRLMRAEQERGFAVDQGLELLREVVLQANVPDSEVVHLPMEELRWLRVLVMKWCASHGMSIERVVAIEGDAFVDGRLAADIPVFGPMGVEVRTVTGKPDVVLTGPGEDEATIVDWKTGFAPPAKKTQDPERPTGELRERLSDMGYVQQVVYGYLLLKYSPVLERVHMREWYVMWSEARTATIERSQMEQIEDVISQQIALLDAAILAGRESSRWIAVPGEPHCGYCARPRDCPTRDEVGQPATLAQAQRLAGEWYVTGKARERYAPFLKAWVDEHGPIPVRHAKGRRMIGWTESKVATDEELGSAHLKVKCSKCRAPVGERCRRPKRDGFDSSAPALKKPHYERWSKTVEGVSRSFGMYEPDDADEGPLDKDLVEAARERGVLVGE